MARSEENPPVLPSLLDRLVDREPRISRDPEPTWEESVEAYRRGVLRDLEWLLNTRRTPLAAGGGHPEVRDSVHNFGIPDLTSLSADSQASRNTLLAEIQEAVRVFEPRLDGARVSLVPNADGEKRRLHFQIEGLLRLDPSPVRVRFDTVMEVGSGRFRVSGGSGHA